MDNSKDFEEKFSKKAEKWGKKMDKKYKGREIAKTSTTGMIMFLGFIGAVVYFIMQADGFWIGVLGVLKAMVWPAILVFELLASVGA